MTHDAQVVAGSDMLLIRETQMQALALDAERRFVDRVIEQLHENFPEAAGLFDEPGLREQVEATLARARSYGLGNDADDIRFVSLAAALGWDFDTQPQNAWMRPLLAPSNGGCGMEALMAECLRRLDQEDAP